MLALNCELLLAIVHKPRFKLPDVWGHSNPSFTFESTLNHHCDFKSKRNVCGFVVLFFFKKKPNIPQMAFLGKFPSICKEDRWTGTVQCVVDMTTVYKSSGKAINSKIHKYSWYHIARQYPRPIHRQGPNDCKEK